MCAGGVLAYLVLIPAMHISAKAKLPALLRPAPVPISGMSPDDIRGTYILYIGAGAVAAGGIISLFRSLPTIWHGIERRLERPAWRPSSQRARAAHRSGPFDEVRAGGHHRADRDDHAVPAA